MKKLYSASVTPFDKDGEINEQALRLLWDKNLAEGVDGFFVCGSSGECLLLSREERLKVFSVAADYLDKADIIAHVGAVGTDEAVFYAKEAKQMGIKRFAAIPPLYFGLSTKEIARYFYDLAEAVDSPILYYNIPGNTHRSLNLNDPDTIALFKSGAIGAVKHSSLDVFEFERIKNLNPDISCYGGYELCMLPFISLDCAGMIGAMFNFMAPQYRRIMDLFTDHDEEEALKLQVKSNNIMQVFMNEGLITCIKYMVDQMGTPVGEPRRPMLPLTDGQRTSVNRVIEENLEIH